MKKFKFLFTLLISSQFLFSQSENFPKKNTQKGFAKIDFLSIEMPITTIPNEPNMGFSGIHYNLILKNNFYTGIGLYGSIAGARGGFFTLGVNAGLKKYLSDDFYIDSGFHFGGGGGAGAPDGGGAFILPHVNLGYNFKNFSVNTGWSYVNFFDKGAIKGHQLNFGLEIPLNFNYADYSYNESEFPLHKSKKSDWKNKTNRFSMMLHINNLSIKGDSQNINGIKYNGEVIRLAGFEIASYMNKNWFGFLKVDGAFDGIDAGYMDVFLGAGYFFSLNRNKTNILAKFGIGAGGGGGVDTRGGVLLYPDLSLEHKVFNDIYLSVNKGFVVSPDSHFTSSSFGLGLKYYIEKDGIVTKNKNYKKGKFKGLEIILKQDLYYNAQRTTEPTENLHQISLQVNLDLNKNLYLSGQTSFANFGNAGAYAEGIVGVGIKLPFNDSTTFFTQFLAGAAGGGFISTGEGLIIKPSIGIDYRLSSTLSLRGAGGYIMAKGGDLSSPFVNLGIKYNISFLKLK
ncbi:hypothetical protein [Polaribacter aquimarinus]|uniref:Uncharacterized protein n=1 Tax=Polaribacter aquimarinus TaxID=2100726 RepID=A0A2U2JA40_9FLAO|nr:hypothetical protein [Polaribacter aquimarinus]PWG05210.1 hypothetical protein DIS07_08160 [Polaribacter aquimarinus]